MPGTAPQPPASHALIERADALDDVLHAHCVVLGRDLMPYRNHAYRVLNFCTALSDTRADTVLKIAIAAAFHDIGIWTEGTFDYLRPSIVRARSYLASTRRQSWSVEIETMILQHHKVLPYSTRPADRLVEAFRRADWIDVTWGVRTFGLPRSLIRRAYAVWPDAGFHRFLVVTTLRRLRTHPLNPLPMMRL